MLLLGVMMVSSVASAAPSLDALLADSSGEDDTRGRSGSPKTVGEKAQGASNHHLWRNIDRSVADELKWNQMLHLVAEQNVGMSRATAAIVADAHRSVREDHAVSC